MVTSSPVGDLVTIATDFSVWDTCVLYRARWPVECTFGSLNSRGFDVERTGITRPDRLERLFGLVILAWISCQRVGVWLQAHVPIKVKAHGRVAMSLVRYGAEQLCHALQWSLPELLELIRPLSTPFHALRAPIKTSGWGRKVRHGHVTGQRRIVAADPSAAPT